MVQLNWIFHFVARLSIASIHLLILTIVAWLALRLYPGDRWTPVRLTGYLAPWLLLALMPGLFVALIDRRRGLAALCTVLTVVLALEFSFLPKPTAQEARAGVEAAEHEVKLMTFNVNFKNRDAAAIAKLLRHQSPDVAAFQEMDLAVVERLHAEAKAEYPYVSVDQSWAMPMVLVSRYPLTPQPKPDGVRRAQHAVVELPGGPVVLWNVHPNPAITSGWEAQRALLASVAGDVVAESLPVVVLGDFNATPQAENYRLVARHLVDVQDKVGHGFGFTFPDFKSATDPSQTQAVRALLHVPPAVRIDHILVSSHFTPQQTAVLPTSLGSDHRPVVATVRY